MSENDSGVDEVICACSSGVTNVGGLLTGVNMADCRNVSAYCERSLSGSRGNTSFVG